MMRDTDNINKPFPRPRVRGNSRLVPLCTTCLRSLYLCLCVVWLCRDVVWSCTLQLATRIKPLVSKVPSRESLLQRS